MGIDIKKYKNGRYRLVSTVSGESLHSGKQSVSEKEAKVALIEQEWFRFLDKVIEIDMQFPHGYHVNDKYHIDESKERFGEWWLKISREENFNELYYEKAKEVCKKLGLDFLKLDENG